MSRLLILPVVLAFAALAVFWQSGGFDTLAGWAALEQREFQNRIARSLRALRGGDAGAMAVMIGACFAYGFFHAIGPGHGKVLLGGYGMGRSVPALRLSMIGLAASLGQALTAIVLVYAGILIFAATRSSMVQWTEDIMAPVSYGAIAAIGLWLVWRGARKLSGLRLRPAAHDHGHHHDHHHHHHHHHDHDHGACADCGHRHGPTLEEVAKATTWRETAALIAGIAIRPCTGALFVLIITWQMGIPLMGIAGAIAMALGTAAVTVGVGLAAAGLRGGMLAGLGNSRMTALVVPTVELAAGLVVAIIATGLLTRALS